MSFCAAAQTNIIAERNKTKKMKAAGTFELGDIIKKKVRVSPQGNLIFFRLVCCAPCLTYLFDTCSGLHTKISVCLSADWQCWLRHRLLPFRTVNLAYLNQGK